MFDSSKLQDAIQFSIDHEIAWDRSVDGVWGIHHTEAPPWNKLLGPIHDRGGVSGAVFVDGELKASWGEPNRPDLTFSVAKTYLALLAGVASDQGILPDVHEPVFRRVPGIGFDEGQNRNITWHHLLQQTSEWQGEFFGMPDQVDHFRAVQYAAPPAGKKGEKRNLQIPGTYWEYNDVRINQLSLALLHLFRRPLADIFRDTIMKPIGASDDWRWAGYDHAWVEIDGQRLPTVPGGTHWGGGVSISALDQLKIGRLLLENGQANGRRVLSERWIKQMRTSCDIAPFYGYLLWLNTNRGMFPSIPESSYVAVGAGGAYTWVEPDRGVVVVVRWLDSTYANEFFGRLYQAL